MLDRIIRGILRIYLDLIGKNCRSKDFSLIFYIDSISEKQIIDTGALRFLYGLRLRSMGRGVSYQREVMGWRNS
jgi:hypothetical protein